MCEYDPKCSFSQNGDNYEFDMTKNSDCSAIRYSVSPDGSETFTEATIVYDRRGPAKMPVPLKRITCNIVTLPTSLIVIPQYAPATQITEPAVEIRMSLWKTPYTVRPGIPVNKIKFKTQVDYMIAETLYFQIQPLVLPDLSSKVIFTLRHFVNHFTGSTGSVHSGRNENGFGILLLYKTGLVG